MNPRKGCQHGLDVVSPFYILAVPVNQERRHARDLKVFGHVPLAVNVDTLHRNASRFDLRHNGAARLHHPHQSALNITSFGRLLSAGGFDEWQPMRQIDNSRMMRTAISGNPFGAGRLRSPA